MASPGTKNMSKPASSSAKLDQTALSSTGKSQVDHSTQALLGGKFGDGRVATEPPYADAELGRTLEVFSTLYQPLGSHARKTRIHTGPAVLRNVLKPDPARFEWVHSDKQYSPYIVFSAETPLEAKSAGPKKLWLPRELHEPKKKGVKNSGVKYSYTDKDLKKSSKKLAARPRWDQEHHIMVSQSNDEVQKYVREYFDKPVRKESEGIPKVRELYAMNDRQSGWWDEPSPLGEPKHTYLDNCCPWNVGGPKVAQKVSYWRNLQKSSSAPVVKASITDSRMHLSLTERTADMAPAQATQFWREWVDLSKKRLPTAPEEKQRGKKGAKGKRGGWPAPDDEKGATTDPQAATTLPTMFATAPAAIDEKEEWNNRWSVCVSKDNLNLTQGHRQYFTSAQFLSGAEMGHPGAYLGLNSQKWRDAAKHVTPQAAASGGAGSRGSVGRTCLLV